MSGTIYVDLRCLQDTHTSRSLTQLVLDILETREQSILADWRTVGLVSHKLPVLSGKVAACMSEIRAPDSCIIEGRGLLIDPSPFGYDLRFSLRLENHTNMMKAAIVDDCGAKVDHIGYIAHLVRLNKFDVRFAISGLARDKIAMLFWNSIAESIRNFTSAPDEPTVTFLVPPTDPTAMFYAKGSMKAKAFGSTLRTSVSAASLDGSSAIVSVSSGTSNDTVEGPCILCELDDNSDEVARLAAPLIVHTIEQQQLLEKACGVEAHVLTTCPAELFDADDLSEDKRANVRRTNGIPQNSFAISAFGHLPWSDGEDICIMALDLLRSWSIPAELYFVANEHSRDPEFHRTCSLLGLFSHVHFSALTRDFLIASDAALQLQHGDWGGAPPDLLNCISAGLPTVADGPAAAACQSPAYVSAMPMRYSPLQVAEQVASIWENRAARLSNEEVRQSFLRSHNFDCYAARLLAVLKLS